MEEIKYSAGEFSIESFTLLNQHGESIEMEGVVSEFILNESIFNILYNDTSNVNERY